jgi:hypothetical protein
MFILMNEMSMQRNFEKIMNWITHPVRTGRKNRERRRLLVNKNTEIVIEGFPRSANSFAVVAFQHAQTRKVSIAHHHHRVEQVIQGVEKNIPVCVLIRDPVDATKSAVLRDPGDVNDRLIRYIEFYRRAWPLRDRFVIATFSEVTSDYGKIIQKINKKFDTNYSLFEHNETNSAKVFDELSHLNSRFDNGNLERSSAPDRKRKEILNSMSVAMDQVLLEEARVIFNQYLEVAEDPTIHHA